ncbi:MAG: hypothetical protein AAGI17_03700 [Planctomycetota bacterium]
MRRTRERTLVRERRGFALPIVMLLALVVGLTSSVMLTRHVAQVRLVQSQYESYQVQHGIRGLQEIVGNWFALNTRIGVEQYLDPDGLAATLYPGDGTKIEIRLFQASGRLLSNTSRVQSGLAIELEDANRRLERSVRRREERDLLTRPVGPAGISVVDADRRVLEAVIEAVTDGQGAIGLMSELDERIERNEDSPIGAQDLGRIITEQDFDPEVTQKLAALLSPVRRLWEMELRVLGTGVNITRGELARYRAYVSVPEEGSSISLPFLSWETVEPEQAATRERAQRQLQAGRR